MLPVRAKVGVLGAGQLALMLAEAAKPLGIDLICAGRAGDCAEAVAPVLDVDLTDPRAVAAFAARVERVTVESENIDAAVLYGLPLYPNARAIEIAQDRWLEKNFFRECDLETAPFTRIDSAADLTAAMERLGTAAILKTRRMGYDGKGQVRLQHASQAAAAWEELEAVPCILEGMVPFDAEASVIAARSASGEIAIYPLIHNVHRDGILRVSTVPFGDPALQARAETYVRCLLSALDYIGVLAVEFFVVGDHLIANEMAPRVHNSGHWTIEGAVTSQFSNHLRALCGLPLGSTASQPMVMLNCIGSMPARSDTDACPEIFRHDYGKASRPGRKVGHLTLPAKQAAAVAEWERRLRAD